MIKIKTAITDINIQYFIENNVHDHATKNRIYDWEEFFRSKLILKLNDLFGNDWRLEFTQVPKGSWLVDIFCKDIKSAVKIRNVIFSTISDFKIEAFFNNRGIDHL